MRLKSGISDKLSRIRKDFLPVAIGFWGIAIPLFLSVFFYCQTTAQKVAIFLSSVFFLFIGIIIYKAKL